MRPKPSSRVRRTVLVKGNNLVTLEVKVILEHVAYVVCEEMRDGLKVGKRSFAVRKGAILLRNTKLDARGHEFYMLFNDGIYDALRSQGAHVPDGYDREDVQIVCYKTTLSWGLQRTWYLNKGSSPEDIEAYTERVGSVERSLAKARDEHKVHARVKAGAAKRPRDRRKRVNFPSRGAIIWSADHGLDRRTKRTRRIRPRVAGRNWRLIALADEAWKAKVDFEREVTQALRWWDGSGAIPSKDVASRMATRFDKVVGSLRSVSLAPYSRRGFARIADDLEDVVHAFAEERFADAHRLLMGCVNAFLMMDARKMLEESCTVASRVNKARIVPSDADVDGIIAVIDRVESILVVDGVPIDRGFKNPVIATRVLPQLAAARAAAKSPDGYQRKAAYKALKAAPAPL